MTRLKSIFILSIAATALCCGTASAATIGGLGPSAGGTPCPGGVCTFVQNSTHPGAPSYVIPFDGVATSFTVQLGNAVFLDDTLRFFTFEPKPANYFTVSADSGPIAITGAPAVMPLTLPVRQKVVAGQLLGLGADLSGTTFPIFPADSPTIDDKAYYFSSTPSLGETVPAAINFQNNHLNMQAVIEADADKDGYGDETQDGCPIDRSEQGSCTAPAISDFKYSLNKFAVAKRGIVLQPAATAQGTNVIITLSKAARVTFEMSQKTTGRKVGSSCKKQTSKNRKKKKCTRYGKPYKFVRELPQGTSNLGFSGRIKVGTKTVSLPVGKYRATASPFSVASNLGGAAATTNFTVVKPRKK